MRAFTVALLLGGLASCLPTPSPGRPVGTGSRPPVLNSAVLLAAGIRADDARAAALAGGATAALASAFASPALTDLIRQIEHMRTLGQRIERRLDTRRLVHWSVSGAVGSGVLRVSGWTSLVIGAAATGWTRFLEQWAFTATWRGGWRVIRADDLPPGAWWP